MKVDFPVSDLLPVWKGRSEVNGCTADSASCPWALFFVMACFVSDAAVSAEYLTSPQEFSPALVSYSSSLPAQVGPMMDSSYSANRQVFFHWTQRKSLWEGVLQWSWSHFIISSGSWIWSLSFWRVLSYVSLTSPLLWSLCISVLPSVFIS